MESGSSRVLGVILFTIIGASALALGVMSMGKNISEPMSVDSAVAARLEQTLNEQEGDKTKDTDGDGLADYDEINYYHTSAYIKDSDSDGKTDGVEVKENSDPNCPEGRDCGTPAPINSPIIEEPVQDEPLMPTFSSDDATAAAQIRVLLKEQGMTDEIINAFDDETLIKMYNESAASTTNQTEQ